MELLEAIKWAGIVGEGGAGFPTYVKLKTKAECFIVNGAECEPLIETDKYLMRTFPDEIVAGTVAISAHLGATRTVIALKAKYEAEIAALSEAIAKAGANIEIVKMPTFYPAGDEHSMVHFVTGRSIPSRGIPISVGCVVDNVGTVRSVYEALNGKLFLDKYLSVTGDVNEPLLLRVPIGTSFRECIAQTGTRLSKYAVISGGPMMGAVIADDEKIDASVVTKTTGNILVLPTDHYLVERSKMTIDRIRMRSRSACIQCRFCTDLCPRYLIGQQIQPHRVMRGLWMENQIKSDEEYLRAFGFALNCCNCGVCEMYACPMGLSPRRVNEHFKTELRKRGLNLEVDPNPVASPSLPYRFVPTERLIARLGLSSYYPGHAHRCIDYTPKEVYIPFRQGIGKPAEAVVENGAQVSRGDLIAKAAEGLSSNIYASIDGTVKDISVQGARIVSGV